MLAALAVFGCGANDDAAPEGVPGRTLNENEADEAEAGSDLEVFRDVVLGGVSVSDDVGPYFSTSTGETYLDSEADEVAELIDIAYVGDNGIVFFIAANSDTLDSFGVRSLPDAPSTAFVNYMAGSDIDFDAEDFDDLSDPAVLDSLTIEDDRNAWPRDELPSIVMFRTTTGQVGALKVTAFESGSSGKITFDIKMQPATD